ncbi:Mu transposase C-terminal domain-containing protein [Cupriavidus taiwanensis]|uniref:Mu transposase C-terminal domain-containing protein n=1 Tax=Cupriavidus taiwanensis TaxID=164546 RepID=UPI0011C1AD15|nr:Mu transposase C-terminal domain-containing protein [Cupriavidus taiwanensis]
MMTHSSFKRGSILSIDDIYHRIVEITGERFQLRAASDGALHEYSSQELLSLYEHARLKVTALHNFPAEVDGRSNQAPVERSLADFSEPIRIKAIRRWKYLTAICPDGRLGFSRKMLRETLRICAEKIEPGKMPPRIATFYSWRRKWVFGRFDIRALIDKWELRGRRPHTDYPDILRELIVEGIEKIYLTEQRESKVTLRDWINARIRKANLARPPEEALQNVSIRLINRFLGQYEKYDVLKRRYGERLATQQLAMFGKGPECTRPLQRVEVDNTPLDILVIDEATRLVLGRPWVTVMIDRYSRMVVGFYVSFRKPSVVSVLRCLRHAMLPKTYMRENYPKIQATWPCYGLIELLVCDNGLEFHAQDLEAACADIGTHLLYCQPRAPHLKGVIERFLKTLNYNFLHLVPGTTYATYEKRLGYDSVAKAVLTLSELQHILHKWIVEIYGATYHRGVNTAPLQRWKEGVEINPPELAPDPERLKVYLGPVETRQLDKTGVQLNNLRYTSAELQRVRGDKRSLKVTVRYNPDDLGAVYVLDPERKDYVVAACTTPDVANGISIEQQNLITRKAKADYSALPLHDAMLIAKMELREYTEGLMQSRISPVLPKEKRSAAAKEALRQHAEASSAIPEVNPKAPPTETNMADLVTSWLANQALANYDVEYRPMQPRESLE